MKKVVLSVAFLIALVTMSFTKSNSNKIVDIQKPEVLNFTAEIIVGVSTVAYPGYLTNIVISSQNETKEFNDKMNTIIDKY